MKKVLFYIPAIFFTLLYGWLALDGIGAIHPSVLVWLLLFWTAGILLGKGISWGGVLGFIPAIAFIYMGTQNTGQIISETPIGVVILLYYAVTIYFINKKR